MSVHRTLYYQTSEIVLKVWAAPSHPPGFALCSKWERVLAQSLICVFSAAAGSALYFIYLFVFAHNKGK